MPNGTQPKNCYARANSPFWWYEFNFDGKRYRGSTGCEDTKGATAFVEALKTRLRGEKQAAALGFVPAQQTVVENGRKQITLSDALDKYEREVAVNYSSFKQCQTFAEWLLNVKSAAAHLSAITHDDVQQYYLRRTSMISARTKKRLSRPSANREIAYLRSVYRHARRAGYDIGLEPTWGKIMDHSAESNRIRELKADEEQRLWVAMEEIFPDLIPVVEFALLSGLRKSAVIGLERDRVDFVNREAKVFLKSKGLRKREHVIPLTDRMIAIIRAQPIVEGTSCVFTYRCIRGGRQGMEVGKRYPFTSTGWVKWWRKVIEKAGIKDFRFHDLRHTTATRIVRKNKDIVLAQRLLGHANIQTTVRYAHAFNDDIRRAMENAEVARDEDLARVDHRDNVVPFRKVS
jgi:integrase